MANRIPRTSDRLLVTWKISNSACPAGTVVEAYKDERGWHEDINGQTYFIFVSMLRNSDLCDIKVI